MIITIEGYFKREIFNNGGDFKVYGFVPLPKYSDVVKVHPTYKTISISGMLPTMIDDVLYKIDVEYVKKGQYDNYEFRKMHTVLKDTDVATTLNFLKTVTSEKRAAELVRVYPNIITMIIKNQPIDISKLNNIGHKTIEDVKMKVVENFQLFDLIEEYKDYGMTINMMKRLFNLYLSVEKIRERMEEDPYYCLTQVSKIGFKTADSMIMNKFPHKIDSRMRAEACIRFLLSQNEQEGNTWIDVRELLSKFDELAKEARKHFSTIIKEVEDIYYNSEMKVVSYNETRMCEVEIANRLLEMSQNSVKWDDINIEEYRDVNGSSLTDEQMKVLNSVCNNNVSILAGVGGCVDKDTEFFNGAEWKPISEYIEGDKVLQYNKDGVANLVYPQEYHKIPCNSLWHFRTKYGLDQCLSDEHRVIYETSKGNLAEKRMIDVKRAHENTSSGFSGKFYTTFKYNGTGIELTDEEIRVMCAVICDGHFPSASMGTNRCIVRLKKSKKKERLEMLLKNAGIEYTNTISSTEGYNVFIFYAPLRIKEFDSYWYNCSSEQLKVICDEILYWDGSQSENRMSFSTTIKSTADFVQFAFASCGYRCSIGINDRAGQEYFTCGKWYTRKSKEYTLTMTKRIKPSMGGFAKGNQKPEIKEYKTLDGYKYCFTVPSGMLVLRRNGRIFITGNSGKSYSMQGVMNMLDDNIKNYMVLASTGKASKILSSYIHKEVKTIHRGLEYNPAYGFKYGIGEYTLNGVKHKRMKLPYDIIIVDEFSMVDIFLLRDLLRAIDTKNTKILFIGDPAQIPSVSVGNVSHDMIQSSVIPTALLTTVFRYGEGGLSYVATEIREGRKYLNQNEVIQTFGTNKDYRFINVEQEDSAKYVKHIYEKYLEKGATVDDIMVLTAYNKGDYGTIVLNKAIQELVNPIGDGIIVKKNGIEVTFRVGDKVMQTKNNYKATKEGDDESEVSVFNGDIGIIRSISDKSVIVEIANEMIVYDRDSIATQLDLAYSMSIHKCLPEDTMIYTDKGIKYLKEFNNGARVGEFKTIENDIKVFNGEYMEHPSNFYNDGTSICNKFTTKRGYQIITTQEHGLDVLCSDGYIRRKASKDISVGDMLTVKSNQNIFGDICKLDKKYTKEIPSNNKRVSYNIPQVLDNKLSLFLGMMVADGVVCKTGIKYGKHNKEVVDKFAELVFELFGYKCKIKHIDGKMGGMWITEVGSTFVRDYCERFEELKANNKRTPSVILSSTKENQCAYLKGRFEDGSVRVKNGIFDNIELVVRNEVEIKELRVMLLNMGIITSHKVYRHKKATGGKIGRIYIYAEHARIFKKDIGFISHHKLKALNYIDDTFKYSTMPIPHITKIVTSLINDNKPKLEGFDKVSKFQKIKDAIRKDRITKNALDYFLNLLKTIQIPEDERIVYLNRVLELNFEPIVSIEKEERHCYCLEMPETHRFVQDGVQGWNCQGSSSNHVILITPKAHKYFLNRNLLYVAASRAKKTLDHIGTYDVVSSALRKSSNISRNTYLKELLKDKFK